jgi:hypothetical protein
VKDILKACRFVAIPKTETTVRPIAIGESIVKIAEAYAMGSTSEQVIDHIHPEQRALDNGGCEKIIHKLRSAHSQGRAIVSLDMVNAFNALSRAAIFNVAERFPTLRPIINNNNNVPFFYSYFRMTGNPQFMELLAGMA